MDTNLIDSCREAHGEIVEFLALQEADILFCDSVNHSQATSPESHGSNLDPRRLRRWLREMENCIFKSPTLTQAMRLKVSDLKKLFEENTVSKVMFAICLIAARLQSWHLGFYGCHVGSTHLRLAAATTKSIKSRGRKVAVQKMDQN